MCLTIAAVCGFMIFETEPCNKENFDKCFNHVIPELFKINSIHQLTSAKLVMAFALYTHHHHHHLNFKSQFLSPLWSDLSM